MSFAIKDGYLYCENLKVKDIQDHISDSPFYLYSLNRLKENYVSYTSALRDVKSIVAYAVKANGNLTILRELRKLGSGAVLVSGNELRLALAAGIDPRLMVFNGNGKTRQELMLAIENGVLVNIDSEFDLEHIHDAAKTIQKPVRVMVRINPDIDARVHPYVSTGIRNSKFGVAGERLTPILDRINASKSLDLVGVHCHLGSMIQEVGVFGDAAALMMTHIESIRRRGFDARYLDIGGGLGIDYDRRRLVPKQADVVGAVREHLSDDLTLIVEPGRSIVGDAGILVTRVIGVKTTGEKHFIVSDGSMSELIRPSLYDAYHEIGFVEPVGGEIEKFDVVGPVCESADFLGRDRNLPRPNEGTGLVVYDAGAYGYAMSSNYNARLRPAEYLVVGDRLIPIRRAEQFDDYLRLFDLGVEMDN